MSSDPKNTGFFDQPKVGNAIVIGLVVASVVVFFSDLAYDKHGHFEFEHWLGFHALFGFLAYLAIVNVAKLLRLCVKRPLDYYDNDGGEK